MDCAFQRHLYGVDGLLGMAFDPPSTPPLIPSMTKPAMNTPTHSQHHLLYGTGPAACWTARHLRAQGITVKAVNRSGKRPSLMPADVPVFAADLLDQQQATAITEGAAVVYQALGPAYSQWAELFPRLQANTIHAAARAGARYVALENLYMLDASKIMTESSPVAPRSEKGRVRQQMHAALMAHHQSGDIQACTLRASDYYGPGVTLSALGERAFGPLIKGKAAQVMVRADMPHSFAYISDVGQALATLGSADTNQATWGRAWLAPHAPAQTQAQVVHQACTLLSQPDKLSVLAPWMLQMVGLFNADAKASIEILYQFSEPFVVDSRFSEKTLGLAPTPVNEGLKATLTWYKSQG
jgi:nucleoside-diphosphate-sugar epimerase